MRDIYKSARKTVIWLGRKSDDSGLALRFITFVGQDRNRKEIKNWTGFSREFEAVRHLCQRVYWSRLWIVQEVIVSGKAIIQCGLDYTKWREFSSFQDVCECGYLESEVKGGHGDLLATVAFNLDRYREIDGRSGPTSLQVLLKSFSSSQCKEIKDKIYALAGVANDGKDLVAGIDYRKSVFEIFSDVIMIQKYHDCGLLIHFSQFLQRLLQGHVAKSVPKFAYQSTELVGALGYAEQRISALGPFYPTDSAAQTIRQIALGFDKASITVSGDFKRHIKKLLAPHMKSHILRRVIPIHSFVSHGLSGGEEFSDYKNGLAGLETVDGLAPMRKSEWPWGQLEEPLHLTETEITTQTEQEYNNARPRFFLDGDGYVGVAPSNIRRSDIICGFVDSDVVAILRFRKDRYFLVGSAVYPRRRGEGKVRLFKGSKDFFQFSVAGSWNTGDTVSLYLNTYSLQLLTH